MEDSRRNAGKARPGSSEGAAMKRSRYVALATVGVVGAAFYLSGQENAQDGPQQAALYASVDACIRANVLDRDTCEAQFRAAQDNYLAQAPKFDSRDACESQFGADQCRPTQTNGAAQFAPAMLGFMIGNYLSRSREAQALLPQRMTASPCAPGVTPQMLPGCAMPRAQGGAAHWQSYSTPSGATVSRSSAGNGITRVPGSSLRPAGAGVPAAAGVARGGFGASASAISAGA